MSNDIEWKMVRLSSVSSKSATKGTTPTSIGYDFEKTGINFIKIESITDNGLFEKNKFAYISEVCNDMLRRSQLQENDILFSIAGALGRVAIVKKDILPANTNQALSIIRLNKKLVDVSFISFILNSSFIGSQIKENKKGNAQQNLSLTQIDNLLIPIPYKNGTPDLETQKQIAQKLDDMDSLIAAKEKLLAKKRNLKVAAMQKLIKDEEGENWKKVKIGDYLRVKTGSKNTEDKIDDGKYPLYVRSPIVERINEYTHDCEAVLTAGDGVGTGKVFHYVNGKFAAHQRVYVISNFTEIDGKYFYYQFSQNFYDEVMKYTAKSSVDSVRRGMITGMEIALPFNSDGSPDLNEQRRIASILSDMDSEISAIEKEITKLQDLKTAMMQKMFCFEDSDSSSE